MSQTRRDCQTTQNKDGTWRGWCNDFPGLYVIEDNRKTALRSIKNLIKDFEKDLRTWGQEDPMINL